MTEHQSVQYKINDKINYKSRSSSQSAEAQKPPSINKRHNGPVGGRRALICTLCSLLAGNNTPGINMEEVADEVFSGFNFNVWSSLSNHKKNSGSTIVSFVTPSPGPRIKAN